MSEPIEALTRVSGIRQDRVKEDIILYYYELISETTHILTHIFLYRAIYQVLCSKENLLGQYNLFIIKILFKGKICPKILYEEQ